MELPKCNENDARFCAAAEKTMSRTQRKPLTTQLQR